MVDGQMKSPWRPGRKQRLAKGGSRRNTEKRHACIKKASRGGITRNPRGFTRRAIVTSLPCRLRRALIRGFQAKGRAVSGPALVFETTGYDFSSFLIKKAQTPSRGKTGLLVTK